MSTNSRRNLFSFFRDIISGNRSTGESSQLNTSEIVEELAGSTLQTEVITSSQSNSAERGSERQTLIRNFMSDLINMPADQRRAYIQIIRAREQQEDSDEEPNPRVSRRIRRRRYRFWDEEAESVDEMNNPIPEDNFVDFRIYPVHIDWKEVENDESHAYDIFDKYGYLGVTLFSTLNKQDIGLDLTPKKFITQLVEYFAKNINDHKRIKFFMERIPSLKSLADIESMDLLSFKDIWIFKLLLDLYEIYFRRVNLIEVESFFDIGFSFDFDCKARQSRRSIGQDLKSEREAFHKCALGFYAALSKADLKIIGSCLGNTYKDQYSYLRNLVNLR